IPASMRRRVLPVSSRVKLPELPDASMVTRRPIVSPRTPRCEWRYGSARQIFRMMAEGCRAVNVSFAVWALLFGFEVNRQVRRGKPYLCEGGFTGFFELVFCVHR